jgi:hypothetical protein
MAGLPPHPDFLKTDEEKNTGAREYALFAMFSHLVYLKHLPTAQRNNADCNAYIDHHPINDIDQRTVQVGHWRRWPHSDGCISSDGLYLETYVFSKGASNLEANISEAVISIRGTENLRGQLVRDWWNNIGVPILGVDPTQYQLARHHISLVVGELRRMNPDVVIYLTGHSLGGGIAQQSAYLDDIKATYVFNTSPVTNWATLKLDSALNQQMLRNGRTDPKIIRVTETGEFLSYVREVTTRATSTRSNRKDVEVRFIDPKIIGSHSIAVLACNFADRLDKAVHAENEKALAVVGERNFTNDMARRFRQYSNDTGGEKFCSPEDLETVHTSTQSRDAASMALAADAGD